MSLEVADFYQEYEDSEFKEIPLTTWKGKKKATVFLRALSRADIARFKVVAKRFASKTALEIFKDDNDESLKEIYNQDLDTAEDYLLQKCVCDHSGKLLFEDRAQFKKWTELPQINDVANEIICHIEQMNNLYDDFDGIEKVIESYKKK